jgi:hypothetical protein
MNPFETKTKKCRKGTFAWKVKNQVEKMQPGDSRSVSLFGKSIEQYRAALFHVAWRIDVKFKTRIADDGSLWVKRTNLKMSGNTDIQPHPDVI